MSASADPPLDAAPADENDYTRASRRLGAAVGFGVYGFVAAFLTLAAMLAFGANRDPTPTELAFATCALWLPALAAAALLLAPGGADPRRARAAIVVGGASLGGFAVAALVGRARFPGYPVDAPAEAIAIRYAVAGAAPGLVAVAVVAARESTRALVRVGAPAAWALGALGLAALSMHNLGHPLRDALPGDVAFHRLEFFNRTGSSRDVVRADLAPAEASAYFARLGLDERPGVMPAWEYPKAAWYTPPHEEGPRWLRVDELPHGIHCSTFATYAGGSAFVQRRCDPR